MMGLVLLVALARDLVGAAALEGAQALVFLGSRSAGSPGGDQARFLVAVQRSWSEVCFSREVLWPW